jgi:LysM repeat protein
MGIKRPLLITLFFLASWATAFGQSSVEHEIVSGNTIYGLAKEYGSTVEAIYEANPNIGVRNLVIGDIIIIPTPEKETIDSSLYVFHKVRSFESVYSVANKYELKDSTIFWHNPVLEGSAILQKNQILKIPKDPDGWKKKSGEFDSLIPNEQPKYEVYIVKKKDTPEELQQAWGIRSIDEFYSLNPDARNNWYKGMALVKPINKAAAQYDFKIKDVLEEDTTVVLNDSLRVACVLPFFLDQYINEGPGKRRSQLAFSYRQGIDLAISEFTEDSSVTINAKYYDSMNQMDTVSWIMEELQKDQPDLILGPMYSSRLMQLSGTGLEHLAVNLISKQAVVRNTNMWNNVVPEDYFWMAIKDAYLERLSINAIDSSTADRRRLLVAGINFGNSASASRMLTKDLNEADYLIVEGDNSWIHNEQLAALDTSVSYDLVITENDPAYILDVLRNLRSSSIDFHWYTHEYQAIDNGLVSNVFAREEVVMFASNFTDFDRQDVIDFIISFRNAYGRHPDKMAMEAYDNTKFHLLRLTQGVNEWRGVRKGFRYGEAAKENSYTEARKFKNLRWELLP